MTSRAWPGIDGPAPMMMTVTTMNERRMMSMTRLRAARLADRNTKVAATTTMRTSSTGWTTGRKIMSEPPESKQTEQGQNTDDGPAEGGARAVGFHELARRIELFLLLGFNLSDDLIDRGRG